MFGTKLSFYSVVYFERATLRSLIPRVTWLLGEATHFVLLTDDIENDDHKRALNKEWHVTLDWFVFYINISFTIDSPDPD